MPTPVISAGTLRACECCKEAFGQLEALRAPIPLGCRHVVCIGCLRDDGNSCPICGVAYDKTKFQTMFDLVASNPHYTPLPLEAEDTARVLHNRCLALTDSAPLGILRDVFKACNKFLMDQPRNKFIELENSVRFLGYQIKAEETIEAMASSMETLARTVHLLNQRVEDEKDGRANDRALFDQQLNEANDREHEVRKPEEIIRDGVDESSDIVIDSRDSPPDRPRECDFQSLPSSRTSPSSTDAAGDSSS